MQFVTCRELDELFGRQGFSAQTNSEQHLASLRVTAQISSSQRRVGGRPPKNASLYNGFAEALNRWLPNNSRRLLWIDAANNFFPSTHELFMAARMGLGETRTIYEAPGHLFDAYPYHESDQLRITE